jgi:predicted deacylase
MVAHTIETLPLRSATLGGQRQIKAHHFGTPGARPRAYLQAGLHANETPGYLILHHLIGMLMAADARGTIVGEIVVVPCANPIGLGAHVLGVHLGRHAIDSGVNFNRGFPDLAALAAPGLEPALGEDAAVNVALIRAALLAAIGRVRAKTELDQMRLTLMALAAPSDYVIDLHCEEDALFAMILGPWCWPGLRDFAADMRPDKVFLADFPPLFDTAISRPWHDLARRFPSRPIPQACLSGCFEMRGVGSVDDATAASDAAHLFQALCRVGAIAEAVPTLPEPAREAVTFKAVEFIKSPAAGIVVYRHELGDAVAAGAMVAEIVDPTCDDPARARTPAYSTNAGTLFARCHTMLVRPDETIAKIAGTVALAEPNHY